MNVKRLAVLLLGCLAVMFLTTSPASAQCVAKYLNVSTPPDLNAEGITERVADIVVYSSTAAGAVPCFNNQAIVTVSYNANLSLPTSFGLGDKGKYWDVVDASESLTVDSIAVTTGVDPTGTVTVIEFTIDKGSTDPTAAIILENLRFDVTGTTGVGVIPPFQTVGDGHALNAYVGAQGQATSGPYDIGNVKKTVDPTRTGVIYTGWGYEDGVCPFSFFCGYPNKGATTGSLIAQAWWEMTTNSAWATDFPFRRVGETSPNAADPNLIGQTDLVLHIENIMSGVTVSVPNSLIVCNSESGKLAEWDYASGSQTATGGDLVAIYKTTYSSLTNPTTLVVATTNGPADSGCDPYSAIPLISVKVGNPSGNSADGTMQAYLNVVMGPATKAQFTGDDAQPTAVPRYLNDVAITDSPTRAIIGAATITDPTAAPYFFLNPTQTVLLYPYVTNADGWQTGLEVGNTGLDTPVFGNTGQNGKIDWYFFPTGGTPFSYTTKAGDGFGLDASGNLEAGGDFAITLGNLMAAAGQSGTFTGYIIAVGHFNFGHGAGMVFNGSGSITAVPALILGGNCSFNPNKAQYNPTTGAPYFPACSSARQGDLTKLPERLVM